MTKEEKLRMIEILTKETEDLTDKIEKKKQEQKELDELDKRIEALKKQKAEKEEELKKLNEQNPSNVNAEPAPASTEEPKVEEEQKDLDANGDEKDPNYDYSEDGKTRINKETGIIEVIAYGKDYKWARTYQNQNEPYNVLSNIIKTSHVGVSNFTGFYDSIGKYKRIEEAKKNQDKIIEILETAKSNAMDSKIKNLIQSFITKLNDDAFYNVNVLDQIKEFEKLKKHIDVESFKELKDLTIKFNALANDIPKGVENIKKALNTAKTGLDNAEKVLDKFRDELKDDIAKDEINDYKNNIAIKFEEYYKNASELVVAKSRLRGNQPNSVQNTVEMEPANYVIDERKIKYESKQIEKKENKIKGIARVAKKISYAGGVAMVAGAIYSLPVGIILGAATLGIKSVKPEKALDEYESKLSGDIHYEEEKFKASKNQNERDKLEESIRKNKLDKEMVYERRKYRCKQFYKYALWAAGISAGSLLFGASLGLGTAIGTGIQFGRWATKDLDEKQREEDEYINDIVEARMFNEEETSTKKKTRVRNNGYGFNDEDIKDIVVTNKKPNTL